MPYQLTGNTVSSTYGKLVQYVSSSFYDGNGNLIPLNTTSASYALTSSFALSTNMYINIDGGKASTNFGGIQQTINGGNA
jgi:hypothetical protein